MRSLYITITGLLATGFAAAAPATAGPGISLLPRQQNFNAVVGAAKIISSSNNDVYPRLPLNKLQQNEDVWNMYLLAMEALQRVPESETVSWYKISGIHGAPFTSWDYPIPSDVRNRPYGYCTHGSVLFITFHRPYLILLEQALVEHAVRIAGTFSGDARTRYQAAARQVRLPFWDAFDKEIGGSIPSIIRQQSISVTKPNGRVSIPNPLYSYRFQSEFQRQKQSDLGIFSGGFGTDPETRRETSDAVLSQQLDYRRGLTYEAFNLPNFSKFSTQAYTDGQTPDSQNSLEMIHNIVHGLIGGWMGYTTFAGFDPIFYLHHANIDRLAALYQAAHPQSIDGNNAVVQPFQGSQTFGLPTVHNEDINTPLYPFRHPSGAEWTSRDVSAFKSIYEYGYSYEELPADFANRGDQECRTEALSHINRLYNPRFVPTSSTSSRATTSSVSTRASSATSAATTSASGSSATSGASSRTTGSGSGSGSGSATATSSGATSGATSGASSGSGSSATSGSGSSATSGSGSGSSATSGSGSSATSGSGSGSSATTGSGSGSSSGPTATGTGISPPISTGTRPPFNNGTLPNPPFGNGTAPGNGTNTPPTSIEHEWVCTVIVDNLEIDDLFGVFVHLGSDNSSPSSKDVIGSVASLGNSKEMKISGYVPLNDKLKDKGVDVNNLPETVEYLKKNLGWKVYKGPAVKSDEIKTENVKSLKVGVSANKCARFDNDDKKLPSRGEWGTFYEATEQKTGGMTKGDSKALKSQDIEKVSDKTDLKPPVVKVIETVYVCPEEQKGKPQPPVPSPSTSSKGGYGAYSQPSAPAPSPSKGYYRFKW